MAIIASEYHATWYEQLKQRRENPQPCIATGITILDIKLNGGFLPSTIVGIGGPPSSGKTSFTLQIVHNMAMQGFPVLIYNYEMSHETIHSRIVARSNQVVLNNLLYDSKITDHEVRRAMECPPSLGNIMYGTADHNLTLSKIENELYLLRKESETLEKTPVILIDYLQKLPSLHGKPIKDYRMLIDDNLCILREIAKQLRAVIIVISSFNRDTIKFLQLDTGVFKESGNIEYDADVLMTMGIAKREMVKDKNDHAYEDWVFVTQKDLHEEKQKTENIILFYILKNRHNLNSSFVLNFDKITQEFSAHDEFDASEASLRELFTKKAKARV
jgi:replicative DNA helicase